MIKFFKETPLVDMVATDDDGKLTDLYISKDNKLAFSSCLPDRRRTCFQCGKEFLVKSRMISEYVYKEVYKGKRTYFCSWTCMSRNRKERKHENKKGK